jgi:hypothetical protein
MAISVSGMSLAMIALGERPSYADVTGNCRSYAGSAVLQFRQNLELRCGFRGPRWSADRNGHYNWCRRVGRSQRAFEYNSRTAALRRCRQGNDRRGGGGIGRRWVGGEYAGYQWSFVWTRIGASGAFSAVWRHSRFGVVRGTVYPTRTGSRIVVRRPPAGGVACVYRGSLRGNFVSGTYSCTNGYTGPWRAWIN